jgi:predicted glycosyltransferase involved in capsule biosynthesis
MIDLKNTTFIIPVKIEHPDRYRNAQIVLKYLNSKFKTNVFIHETTRGESRLDFLAELDNLNIKLWKFDENDYDHSIPFHRTKYLNIMLDEVETPVTINYDIDVLLEPNNYKECEEMIISGIADVIFPYENGSGQFRVEMNFDYNGFVDSSYSMDFINSSDNKTLAPAECGHCIFFNTDVYKKRCGENENFISYGPEDKERMYRFQKLGNTVIWREGKHVFHLEHHRGDDSWVTNPYFQHNWKIFDDIKLMDDQGLIEYYENQNYTSTYKTIGNK